MRTRS